MNTDAGRTPSEARFFAFLLWLCAAAAVWLLLSPAAFTRRALTRRAERADAQVRREWIQNVGLERWRNGLESDPSVIEREARKLGYGRPNEHLYPLTPAELAAARARMATGLPGEPVWVSALSQSVAPALILLITGILAFLFFTDLRVDDPYPLSQDSQAERREQDKKSA